MSQFSTVVNDCNEKYSNDFTDIIHNENRKKKEIILAWADKLAQLHKEGQLNSPINQVSSIISQSLRDKGHTENQIDYVRKVLDEFPEFKDSNYSHGGGGINSPNTGEENNQYNNNLSSIFLDFDELAKQDLTDTQLSQLSAAERQEYMTRTQDKLRELKRRITDIKNKKDEQAKQFNVQVGLEKESSELPPDVFQGQTEFSKMCYQIYEKYKNIAEHFKELGEETEHFKPTDEVSNQSVELLERWMDRQKPFEKFITLNLKYIKYILNPIKDRKYAADLEGWLKNAWDNVENYGAHGSGKKNAIGTGEYVAKMSKKEQDTVEVFEIGRELTREQVGDKTKGQMLERAKDIIHHDELQQACRNWTDNTSFQEKVMDLDEFVKSEKKREMLSR